MVIEPAPAAVHRSPARGRPAGPDRERSSRCRAGRQFQVTTTTATIGIRGTGFYVESDPEQTYFCTCYGRCGYRRHERPGQQGDGRRQAARPAALYRERRGTPGRSIRNAPFINHTDQELALIETLVGRTPPFVFPKDIYQAPRREY